MKLSDVRGERTLDVIADIIPPVARIAKDDAASAIFRPEAVPEGMEPTQFFASRVERSAPALLKGHRDDVVAILAAIEGTSPEEYASKMNLASLLKDVMELLTDSEFLGFLSDCAQDEDPPTGPSESTGDQPGPTAS